MANYYATWRSNYFKVKDPEAFKKEMAEISDIEVIEGNNTGHWAILGKNPDGAGIPCFNTATNEEIDLPQVISSHLVDGEVAVLMEVGSEKMRYLVGVAFAVNSRGKTRQVVLQDIYDKAKKLAPGKPITRVEY